MFLEALPKKIYEGKKNKKAKKFLTLGNLAPV